VRFNGNPKSVAELKDVGGRTDAYYLSILRSVFKSFTEMKNESDKTS